MLSSSFESKNNTNCLLNVFSAFIPFFFVFPFPSSQSDQILPGGQRETAVFFWL